MALGRAVEAAQGGPGQVRSDLVVVAAEPGELALQAGDGLDRWRRGEPFRLGLLKAFDLAAGLRMVCSGVVEPDPEPRLPLAEEIEAELVPMRSAGAKVISVARDVTDAYVHAGGQYEWDSAPPGAVARATGLHTSRADGAPLKYNPDHVLLRDVLVCRPEFAGQIAGFVTRYWADHPAG